MSRARWERHVDGHNLVDEINALKPNIVRAAPPDPGTLPRRVPGATHPAVPLTRPADDQAASQPPAGPVPSQPVASPPPPATLAHPLPRFAAGVAQLPPPPGFAQYPRRRPR